MSTITIEVVSEQQWLAERAKDVTSTEVAALYGLSPYITEFELWHRKRGVEVEFDENDRTRWGRRLETAIAAGVAEDHGWEIRHRSLYQRLDDLRFGASFDFEILNHERGPGLMEIKNVDALVFRDQWSETDGQIAAPDHIELQLQAQLDVSGFSWGCIVALVGGNDARILMRDRDRDIGDDMRRRVASFWRSVDANQPPAADFERDSEFIVKSLRRNANAGEVIDADAELEALLVDYREASAAQRFAEARRDARKAEILLRIGTASKVRAQSGSLSCGETKPNKGTLVTADMVGTYVGAREGFRQFRFYPNKETER